MNEGCPHPLDFFCHHGRCNSIDGVCEFRLGLSAIHSGIGSGVNEQVRLTILNNLAEALIFSQIESGKVTYGQLSQGSKDRSNSQPS